jgi:hypothetical protein
MALVLVNVATLHKDTEVHAYRLNSCGLRTYWQKYGVSSTCLGVLYWQFFLLTGPTIFPFLYFYSVFRILLSLFLFFFVIQSFIPILFFVFSVLLLP